MAASRTLAAGRPHDFQSSRLARGLLHGTLFLAILLSPFVFIEPAPYELMMGVLAIACLAARVAIPRLIALLLMLLIVWNIGGTFSLIQVHWKSDAVIFMGTSIYLAVTAILFACLFAEESVRRLSVMRTAYILAALIAAGIGIAAYFALFPGSEQLTMGGRAKSTFKDPNVYAPFLVLPLLFLVETSLRDRIKLITLAAIGILTTALLLAFSRGAWVHAAVSIVVLMGVMFLTANGGRLRMRIVFLGAASLAALSLLVAVLISFESIGALFEERAAVVQYYDAGEGGRFGNQIRSLPMLLERPNGFGPLEFGTIFPQAPHNVYLNAFASYGWIGGIAYLLMILITLSIGFRYALVRTPWQPFFIPIYATFVGVAIEGIIVDTDHWRHFYLLLGAIWGLSAATLAHLRRESSAPVPRRSVERTNPAHFVVSRIG